MVKMIMIIMNTTFMMMTLPMQKILILASNLLFFMLTMSMIKKNSWFPIICLILFLNGLLILFIYMTSLSHHLNLKLEFYFINFFILTLIMMKFWNIKYSMIKNKSSSPLYVSLNFFSELNFLINLIILISYLLLILLMFMEMISNFKSSFRSY